MHKLRIKSNKKATQYKQNTTIGIYNNLINILFNPLNKQLYNEIYTIYCICIACYSLGICGYVCIMPAL